MSVNVSGFLFMRIEVGNWTLEKASKTEDAKILPVRMIANRMNVDKEDQEMLPQAFNKATVDNFLEHGIIDWHHQSVLGKTTEERAHAIIGRPYDFKWESTSLDKRDLPVVYANLTKAHSIVRDSIIPHLEAEQKVFAASVGGSIRKAKMVFNAETNQKKDQIMEIVWDCLSVAAAPYVISAGSEVTLVKAAFAGNPEDLSSDIICRVSDISMLTAAFLAKALEVGAGTNSATLVGADAMRMQSGKKKNNDALIKDVTAALKSNKIQASRTGVEKFLRAKGLQESEIESFMPTFLKAVRAVL